MRKKTIIFSVSTMLFLISLSAAGFYSRAADSHFTPQLSNSQLTVDSWPAFRHDLQHTGQSFSTAPNTNQILWTYNTGSYQLGGVTSSPAVVDGIVYVGSKDSNIYAFNASTGTVIWTYLTRDGVESSPTVVDGRVFVGSDDNKVYALNASTGAFIWSYATTGYVISSPAVADDLVFVASKDYKVYALDEATGSQVWNYTTGNFVDTSPAVSNGVVFIGSDDYNVYALNTLTGANLWTYTTGAEVSSSPAVVNGLVFVGSKDHNLYALNEMTGSLVWKYSTSGHVDSSPAVSNGIVYVGSNDGNVYALNAITGTYIWSFTAGSTIYSSPAVADGKVFISPSDGNVYALDAYTGMLVWTYATGPARPVSHVYSSPAVAEGKVYVGTHNGTVYAFGSLIHDVVITEATTSQTLVGLGQDLNITVTAENQGDYQETFNLTVYTNTIPLASKNITLSNGEQSTITLTWNTSGFACGDYIITAYAWPVPDETDTSDNTLNASLAIHVGIPDSAITGLSTLNTIIGQNYSTSINVTAASQGDYSPITNIVVYANETVIAAFENITPSSENTTLTFTWNTNDFAKGNYTISAHIQSDPYETDTTNNDFASPVAVKVGIPGDIVLPFDIVDMKDIAYLAKRFNTDASSPSWDPNADFDGSRRIDMKDIAVVARNFQVQDP